ncbi:MAG: hypothetical protein ACK55I_00150, partial [bacterium]
MSVMDGMYLSLTKILKRQWLCVCTTPSRVHATGFSGKRFRIPKSKLVFSQPLYNLVQPLVQR